MEEIERHILETHILNELIEWLESGIGNMSDTELQDVKSILDNRELNEIKIRRPNKIKKPNRII